MVCRVDTTVYIACGMGVGAVITEGLMSVNYSFPPRPRQGRTCTCTCTFQARARPAAVVPSLPFSPPAPIHSTSTQHHHTMYLTLSDTTHHHCITILSLSDLLQARPDLRQGLVPKSGHRRAAATAPLCFCAPAAASPLCALPIPSIPLSPSRRLLDER